MPFYRQCVRASHAFRAHITSLTFRPLYRLKRIIRLCSEQPLYNQLRFLYNFLALSPPHYRAENFGMPYLHNYRLFVSHAWRYSEGYVRMLNFINSASNFLWTNYSVPESKAFTGLSNSALEEQLRNQIRPTQCVVVLAGMYVAHSSWIQFEIDFAKSLNKPILGVVPWGAERTPQAVVAAADKMVHWNSTSIVSGIRSITP